MKTMIFYDWKPGFNKVKFNHLLRETAGYSLPTAINAVEQLLRREPLEISFNSDEGAESLIEEAFALGTVGEVKET